MPSATRPNQALMSKALRIFLHEMVPCVIQEVKTAAGQSIEAAAIQVHSKKIKAASLSKNLKTMTPMLWRRNSP